MARAGQVQQFDTIESVLLLMKEKPTSIQERGYSSIDPNADTQTFFIWEYGKSGRIFIGFYNGLSSELKIGSSTRYRANLYDHERDPRYNIK